MYKLLLCWRYLRTRFIALASIISVMLGVATMIVVNAVMEGFSHEMQERMHGILADVVFESRNLSGAEDAQAHMEKIRLLAGDDIAGMTPTVHVPAMLSFQYGGQWLTHQVTFIGIDKETHSKVSDFARYLQHPENRENLSFELREGGYDVSNQEAGEDAKPRKQLNSAGWPRRRANAIHEKLKRTEINPRPSDSGGTEDPFLQREEDTGASGEKPQASGGTRDPFAAQRAGAKENEFDVATEQHTGIVMGIAIASFRDKQGFDRFVILPGDDVRLTFPTAGTPPKAVSDVFTVVDFYESRMSEYDSKFIFVDIHALQKLRGMVNPSTGVGHFNSIQIKVKDGVDLNEFRDRLRGEFPPEFYGVYTWRDKQNVLLAAVDMETAILNVLLFLIIAVAGFGILAIFFMIVVEKTRDIGVLKSLGASSKGVMGIFLGYGLSLGVVGSGVGMVLGLLFVRYINQIADLLGRLTGRPVFDPTVYYFHRIPTIIEPATVTWIVGGAMAIAILASVLPARRAARLHPVEALRYE